MSLPLLALALAAGPAAFERLGVEDGVVVEARRVEGSDCRELRLSMTVPGPAAPLCRLAFGDGRLARWESDLALRVVLREGPGERVTYERTEPPLASPRDFVVRTQLEASPDGACRVRFAAVPGEGPAPRPGWVRVTRLEGSFDVRPQADGTVQVVHAVFTEPGGNVPGWMAEGPRKASALGWMRALAAEARRPTRE